MKPPSDLISLMQMQEAWATAWGVWVAWGLWVEAWGVWALAMVTRAIMVTKLDSASKRRQDRALGEEAWAEPTANKPKQGLGAKGAGMASKGVAAMADKQVAEVQGGLGTDPTDAYTPGQPLSYSITIARSQSCLYVCKVLCVALCGLLHYLKHRAWMSHTCMTVHERCQFVFAVGRSICSLDSSHFVVATAAPSAV